MAAVVIILVSDTPHRTGFLPCRIFLQLQSNLMQKVIKPRPWHYNPPRLCPAPYSAMTRYKKNCDVSFCSTKGYHLTELCIFLWLSNFRTSGWPQNTVLGNQRSNQEGWSPAPVLPPVCQLPNRLTVASLLMPTRKTTMTSSLRSKSQGMRLPVAFSGPTVLKSSGGFCAQPVVQTAAFWKGREQSQVCSVTSVHDWTGKICSEVTNTGTSSFT